MAEFASKGVAGTGLGLGIAGTSLGLLGTGLLGIMGNRNVANNYITREEFNMGQELARKDSEIALLKSEQNTEVKIADVYERIMTRVNADARAQADWNASQSVVNAQISAAVAVNSNSIASLQNTCDKLTKVVIPNSSVCPGWGEVKVTPVPVTTTVTTSN
ncbi:MAG: hypothetical protein MJ191_00120 [Clostridium sp.]|nr:hypothetical protein [Clostridium sp.]